MSKKIVVDVGLHLTRIGVLEEAELVELFIEKNESKKIVGNIYKGQVMNVLPGMKAAFVDIGQEKNAFLYLGESQPIFNEAESKPLDQTIKQGQDVLVQVKKEAIGNKGPSITTNISIPGKYLVFTSDRNNIGISQKIHSNGERERLKKIVSHLKPSNCGVIVRTDAEGKTEEELKGDIDFLQTQWNTIIKKEKYAISKSLLYQELSPTLKAVRDLFSRDMDMLIINNKSAYLEAVNFISVLAPTMEEKIHFEEREISLFEYYSLESKVEKALQPYGWLKSGGTIVIEQTEALVVIDVNSGKYVGKKNLDETILKTNLEAAAEIPKQIRLRNLSGIIIIDFIDMKREEDKKIVLKTLEQELQKDRIKTSILGMTSLGLVEMTRKKTRNPIHETLLASCPCCNGNGNILSIDFIMQKIEKEMVSIFTQTIYTTIILEAASPIIQSVLDEKENLKEALEKKYNKNIQLKINNELKMNDYKIYPVKSKS